LILFVVKKHNFVSSSDGLFITGNSLSHLLPKVVTSTSTQRSRAISS
jgi:hypothetical protein